VIKFLISSNFVVMLIKGDTHKYQGLRKELVQVLKQKGINDEMVLSAINSVPRHLFFDKVFHDNFAYNDVAFPIGAGQTISQPYTVAFQSSLLELKKGMKVLEIGTGSGYQTAILVKLGCKVFTIERQKELFTKTKPFLEDMGYRAQTFFGDGFEGREAFAPFDRILVTCGAPFVPEKLVAQLANNGRMVIPIGDGKEQIMTLITKDNEGQLHKSTYGSFSFVPMLLNKQY
jgi:protein-L-isoaspartate(D-aspartate) O-methyltransferase